jgi:hypothetical protein
VLTRNTNVSEKHTRLHLQGWSGGATNQPKSELRAESCAKRKATSVALLNQAGWQRGGWVESDGRNRPFSGPTGEWRSLSSGCNTVQAG